MKTYTPKKPVGDTAIWTWRRWIWDLLAGGLFPIKGDGNVVVSFEQGFYRISTKPSTSSAVTGKFRGEYSATVGYNPQDEVVITTGSNAGTYVCVTAATNKNPWAGGGYWVQISGIPANIYL